MAHRETPDRIKVGDTLLVRHGGKHKIIRIDAPGAQNNPHDDLYQIFTDPRQPPFVARQGDYLRIESEDFLGVHDTETMSVDDDAGGGYGPWDEATCQIKRWGAHKLTEAGNEVDDWRNVVVDFQMERAKNWSEYTQENEIAEIHIHMIGADVWLDLFDMNFTQVVHDLVKFSMEPNRELW